ncbi:DUF6483 family protein [Paenibacillus filicis]|uniref:DUF6483 family protein n=1 Tax=Paenibacillus gyeongsangnamensis TaxID=3388067 RepID=A0ABT4QH30_9BACL|nr:DUF6483 family protein [Paenibacillus filicis]MCZ8516161.1 DUF6483 family protein [Paenibacillus filicis]
MYKRDYILRMLEDAAGYLHKAVFLRRNRKLEEALELLNQAFRSLLGIGSKLLYGLSAKDLLAMLSRDGTPNIGKALVLGDLMTAEALVLREADESGAARRLSLKALEVLLNVRGSAEAEGWKDELNRRIDGALEQAGRERRNANLLRLEWRYYIEEERYDKAEDALFHLLEALEAEGMTAERLLTLEEGIHVYGRWLEQPEERLSAGNLPLKEIKQSLDELKKMKSEIS